MTWLLHVIFFAFGIHSQTWIARCIVCRRIDETRCTLREGGSDCPHRYKQVSWSHTQRTRTIKGRSTLLKTHYSLKPSEGCLIEDIIRCFNSTSMHGNYKNDPQTDRYQCKWCILENEIGICKRLFILLSYNRLWMHNARKLSLLVWSTVNTPVFTVNRQTHLTWRCVALPDKTTLTWDVFFLWLKPLLFENI